MEIGLKLESWFLSPDLWMGVTLAILSELGKVPVWKESFTMCFKIGDNSGSKCLMILIGYVVMLEDLFLRRYMTFFTSKTEISLKKNELTREPI